MPSAVETIQAQVHQELNGAATIIVLGASGDLAKKKTYPALFGLFKNNFLPENTRIVGYARSEMAHDDFVKRVTDYIKPPKGHEDKGGLDVFKDTLEAFKKTMWYQQGQYDEDKSWKALDIALQKSEEERGLGKGQRNRVFYMALPPSVFIPVAQGLKRNAYGTQGHNRLVVEKPFGMDLETSNNLAAELGKLFTEEEIYRIDHYLGKEMVKNIMNIRFANILFGNQVWHRHAIDNVQITFKEPFGTEGRGGYFDDFGIIRDVMQNHLLQVLTLVAMERPISTDPEAIRDEKVKVLRCVKPIAPEDTVLGQYVRTGDKPGYLEDDTLKNKKSRTPTFAAIVCHIHNERWEGVPFILRAGKALNEAKVEVRIQFRSVAGNLFNNTTQNELVIRVQPDEAVYMKFNNKQPGLSHKIIQADLNLSYHDRYTDLAIPDAYESLLLDVLRNDHSNFVRDDELEAAWRIFTPLLHAIDAPNSKVNVLKYEYGSRGPKELEEFMKNNGYNRVNDDGYVWPQQSLL